MHWVKGYKVDDLVIDLETGCSYPIQYSDYQIVSIVFERDASAP